MRCSTAHQPNNMGKKNSLNGKGEKPLSFRQAILLAGNTPHLTHKQIDELRKKGLLKKLTGK
jgi:hypothetical protein